MPRSFAFLGVDDRLEGAGANEVDLAVQIDVPARGIVAAGVGRDGQFVDVLRHADGVHRVLVEVGLLAGRAQGALLALLVEVGVAAPIADVGVDLVAAVVDPEGLGRGGLGPAGQKHYQRQRDDQGSEHRPTNHRLATDLLRLARRPVPLHPRRRIIGPRYAEWGSANDPSCNGQRYLRPPTAHERRV